MGLESSLACLIIGMICSVNACMFKQGKDWSTYFLVQTDSVPAGPAMLYSTYVIACIYLKVLETARGRVISMKKLAWHELLHA